MTDFFKLLINFFKQLAALLNSYTFEMYGFSVSLLSVMVVMLLLSMVVAVFWKGAKG